MASSREYYYQQKPLPTPAEESPYDWQGRYNNDPTPPPYTSQHHLTATSSYPDHRGNPAAAAAPPISPFESVFDDHVYPASSRRQSGGAPQHPFQQDTGYYGLGRRSPSEENMPPSDDIPLQTRPGPNNPGKDGYEPDPDALPRRQKSRSGRVHFGELGMFGANKKRIPFVVYTFTVIQVAVFIGEIVKNAQLTGSPIMTQPQFNPMIGPSTYVLINMGSRFVACMHDLPGIPTQTFSWPCPNTTTNDALCSLSDLCGFGGFPPDAEPNQWFRFIVPIFMHAGIIHIGFNLLLQLTMGREMEKSIGPIRFFLVYMSAGIFGFVMGANYAATGISSTGASGSLFGVIALTLLDLLYSWRDRRSPVKELMFILLDVIISFVLGLLPGLDNFSHIGGFLMGIALGICILHSPNFLRRRMGEDAAPEYAHVRPQSEAYPPGAAPPLARQPSSSAAAIIHPPFLKHPVAFFKGRKPLWWAWWLLRVAAVVLIVVGFILLLNNFYLFHNTCSWCRYLSCLPINNWCEIGNLQLTNVSKTSRRDVLPGLEHMAQLWKV